MQNSKDNPDIERELRGMKSHEENPLLRKTHVDIYDRGDFEIFPDNPKPDHPIAASLKTLDELLEQDRKREKDGFPRRIRIGKYIKPNKNNKGQIVVVPTTTEPKNYHDDSVTDEEEDTTGGSGEGEEGEVIGEQPVQPQEGEGEGSGAGQGQDSEHDISSEAFDLGKMLTEKFEHRLKNCFVFFEIKRDWRDDINNVIDSIRTKHNRTK